MPTPKHIITSTALVISLAALAAPSAGATLYGAGSAARYSLQDKAVIVRPTTHLTSAPYSRPDKQVVAPVASQPQPVARVSTPRGGLTPVDGVAIGLGAMALLALGGAATRSRTRGRRARTAVAPTH